MLKRLMAVLLCLLMSAAAFAEGVPALPGLFTIEDKLPKSATFTVHTGPGEEYYVAAKGKARVSTGGVIQCYGRMTGTNWLLIRYSVNDNQFRVGYIDALDAMTLKGELRQLTFAAVPFVLPESVTITDDPYGSGKALGDVCGGVTLLAWRGTDWAYVEGTLENTGEPVRGFIPRTTLSGLAPLLDIPMAPYAGERFVLDGEYALNLPDDALTRGMEIYPLPDGNYLIAYCCRNSEKLWLRVISDAGKKLWAKSVPGYYYSQITLTKTGFICETFDNSEIDSGMRYTYTCKGRKWTSKKVRWIEEPDRFYSDSTANYAVCYYIFCEGMTYPITVTCNASGATAEHLMQSYQSDRGFLYEMDGELLMLAKDEMSRYVLRIYGEEAEELASIPVPENMPPPIHVVSAAHDDNAVYFFTHESTGWYTDPERGWRMWRFDRAAQTFRTEPVNIPISQPCTLTAIGANAAGSHDILMETELGAYLCQLTASGKLLLHQSLPGDVTWVANDQNGGFFLILQNRQGEFILQHYSISEG